MSLRSAHVANVAHGSGEKKNCPPFTEVQEDLVARQLPLKYPTVKRDEKNLGVLGCTHPTVMITRTRSVEEGILPTGIVDHGGSLPSVAVKGVTLVPQTYVRTLDVCENTSTNINTNNTNINTEIVLPVPRKERMKKRKYVYFEKTKKFEPASQVELLEKNDVRTNSDNTDSIRTDINSCEVEDSFDCHVHNPYFVSMSQDDLKKQKAFAERLRRKRLQKIQKECPKKAKKELTITEKIERRKKCNERHYEKRKKELKITRH